MVTRGETSRETCMAEVRGETGEGKKSSEEAVVSNDASIRLLIRLLGCSDLPICRREISAGVCEDGFDPPIPPKSVYVLSGVALCSQGVEGS